jgi:hypothetical protein
MALVLAGLYAVVTYDVTVPLSLGGVPTYALAAALLAWGSFVTRYGYREQYLPWVILGALATLSSYVGGMAYVVTTDRFPTGETLFGAYSQSEPLWLLGWFGALAVIVFSFTYVYALWSSRPFTRWGAGATLLFAGALIMAAAGLALDWLLLGAAYLSLFSLVVYLAHLVGVMKRKPAFDPLREGTRLFVGCAAFVVELPSLFLGVVRRVVGL